MKWALAALIALAVGAAVMYTLAWMGRDANFRGAYYGVMRGAQSHRKDHGNWPTREAEIFQALPEGERRLAISELNRGNLTFSFGPIDENLWRVVFTGYDRGSFRRAFLVEFPP